MKKLLTLLLVLITCSVSAIDMGPYDPGAARKSDLNLKLDLDGGNAPTTIPLINASFTGDIDVTGDVGAATVNGVAPLTAGEKTQALVGSSSVDFIAKKISFYSSTGLDSSVSTLERAYVAVANGGTTGTLWIASGTTADIAININGAATANMKLWRSGTTLHTVYNDMTSIASTTKDAAGRVNFYIESGNLTVQNNWTGTANVRATILSM